MSVDSPRAGGLVLLAALALDGALWLALPPGAVIDAVAEGSAIEAATAAGFFLLAPLCALFARRADAATRAALAVFFLGFAAREMDWHKLWTGSSVLRLSWYVGPAAPGQRLIALMVVAAFALAVGWLLRRHARAWWQGWRRSEPVALGLLALRQGRRRAQHAAPTPVDRTGPG